MKIDTVWSSRPEFIDIPDAVAYEVDGRSNGFLGQIEQLEAANARLTYLVGRLLDVLATEGLVSVEETRTIIRGY